MLLESVPTCALDLDHQRTFHSASGLYYSSGGVDEYGVANHSGRYHISDPRTAKNRSLSSTTTAGLFQKKTKRSVNFLSQICS